MVRSLRRCRIARERVSEVKGHIQAVWGGIIIRFILVKDKMATLPNITPRNIPQSSFRGPFRALRIPYALESSSFNGSDLVYVRFHILLV